MDAGVCYYQKSMSIDTIATYYGIPVSGVAQALKMYRELQGIAPVKGDDKLINRNEADSVSEILEIKKLRNKGYTYGQIGARLGFTEELIRAIMS